LREFIKGPPDLWYLTIIEKENGEGEISKGPSTPKRLEEDLIMNMVGVVNGSSIRGVF